MGKVFEVVEQYTLVDLLYDRKRKRVPINLQGVTLIGGMLCLTLSSRSADAGENERG